MTTATHIRLSQDTLQTGMPNDYIGPITLPGNGRTIYWTGRVAIGIRHQAANFEGPGQSAIWIQNLLLDERMAA